MAAARPLTDRVRSSPSQLLKPATSAGFGFIPRYGDKLGNMGKKYKPPTLHMTGRKWYVEFYYRVPDSLRTAYKNKIWERFKVYENINRVKSAEYSYLLKESVEYALKQGFNPFEEELQAQAEQKSKIVRSKEWTILQAINYFKQKWSDRGLNPDSLSKYIRVADRLIQWLIQCGFQRLPASEIKSEHLEAELTYYKNKLKWSNRTYNNELEFQATIFNFLAKKKINNDKPHSDIDKQKAPSKKHRYYDELLLPQVKAEISKVDPYLAFAAECVYSLCIRSDKELKNFKVGNIFPERKQVFLTAGGTKTNADRFIPMTNELIASFRERGIIGMPRDWYVFGQDGKPGPEPMGTHWAAVRFRQVRRNLKISTDFTLQGFKHTKVVHMKKDGAKDDEIMAVTGHKDFGSYAKYLRDLGMDVDVEAIQKKSRAW